MRRSVLPSRKHGRYSFRAKTRPTDRVHRDRKKALGIESRTWPPRLSELVDYRASLLDLGLDCDTSYTRLREGVYPIDSSKEALRRVAVDPPEVAMLAADPFLSTICFLAPNSD